MPSDIMDTDRTTFSDNLTDELLYPKVINNIKSIWLESNSESDSYSANSILQSSEMCNSDYLLWQSDSFVQEVLNYGFIIGSELENVKSKSRRSLMQQMSNHISKNFQSMYGKENNGVRQNYFQIGVRVPSKEHVSEIVGKQGLKIKEIRENTGALIITPGESEDHVFIIEATPLVAFDVAKFIADRANEITTSRARDNFQKSLAYSVPSRFAFNKPFTTVCASRPILATGVIEVPKNIVGRIIGTHGSIITTIQKNTGTEIRSPPKDNHLSNNNNKAKFEILVYQKSNSIDMQEAIQRIKNAKQLIAHVAMHQMERIRAEESPFSNYRIKNFTIWENGDSEKSSSERSGATDKEKLLNYQMQSVAWMWTDIDRLDELVSEEVVLRILEESKKKSKLRSDYGIVDSANPTIDRFNDISLQQLSPYKQNSPFIYDSPQYSSSHYSDISPTQKSTSPNPLNGVELFGCQGNHYQTVMSVNQFDLAAITSNGSVRPSSLCYNNPIDSHLTTKSYAEHLKSFTTTATNTTTTSIVVATNCTSNHIPGTCTSAGPCSNGHGAIGDHIRKVNNQNNTAQLNKI